MKQENVAEPDARALQMARYGDKNEFELAIAGWMQKAGQEVPDLPTLSTDEVQALRVRLIQEELDELKEAYEAGDIVGVYDACLDLIYVVEGTGVAHGFNLRAGFEAVHNNNMDKLARGHKDEGGKFIKPADHLPPDLWALLEMQYRMAPIRADGDAMTCDGDCDGINNVHPADTEPYDYLHVLCDGRRVKL